MVRFLSGLGFLSFILGTDLALAQAPLSDPTAPLGYSAKIEAVQRYALTSIFMSPVGSKAIVNGQLVKVGDSVGSGKVIAINESAVAVETKDGVQHLVLHRQIKKNSATQ